MIKKQRNGIKMKSKNYLKLFTKEQLVEEYKTKSVCDIAKKFNVPQGSMYNIFRKFKILRRKSNAGGIFAPGFKHGKCTDSIPKFCKCGHRLSNNSHAINCIKCHNKLLTENTEITLKRSIAIKRRYEIDPKYRLNRTGKNNPNFGKLAAHSKGSYYKNIWMRSSYEILFVNWLDNNNIKWEYEPKTFDLGNTTYTPDFYLPEFNIYIEVKGWWRPDAKIKFDLFNQLYVGYRIKIVDKKELQSIGVLK
jgi:hypothetical protein